MFSCILGPHQLWLVTCALQDSGVAPGQYRLPAAVIKAEVIAELSV